MSQLSHSSAFNREIDAEPHCYTNQSAPRSWYGYCEKPCDTSNVSPDAILNLKNFVRSVGWPQHGWAKTFAAVDPAYKDLTVDEIINRIFATSNRDGLVTYLESVKYMYQVSPSG
jgi:hypothetical protein